LIIDADSGFREHLARYLQSRKWKILFADGLDEAKKSVKRRNIDVVLLGMSSLKSEGLAILRMIKKVSRQTEVIMLGSVDQIAFSIEGMKLGAFDDFMGPFDVDALIRRIEAARIRKKQRQEKKPLLRRYMDAFAAGAFAEAGESDMALAFMEKDAEKISDKEKKEQKNGKD